MSAPLALLIGLGPLLGWGLFPTVASKIGGKPANQILGATSGTLIFAIIFTIIVHFTNGVELPSGLGLIMSILSGIGWGFGQTLLFLSFRHGGSSKMMPITTAWQLIVTDFWGMAALGNWQGIKDKIIGIICLAVIVLGAVLTSYQEKKDKKNKKDLKIGVILILVAGIGQWLYSAAPQLGVHVNGSSAFLPQAVGMLVTACIYSLIESKKHQHNYFTDKTSKKQIFAGFFFAFGTLTYLISAQPYANGMATAFVLSQASVIVATITSIYMLHQHKTTKEMIFTISGLLLILGAAAITAFVL